ncbi:MAG: alpha-E domain-containing protein [Lachnospiraceae bacterium]|nr:alpha-E domain-containing protein [Lachnospiraceae bacterium]
MGIISVENTDRLFWLGRYSERVVTTLRLFAVSFDRMIDFDFNDYVEFCKELDIPNIYTSKDDFVEKYLYDPENQDSLYANLDRAFSNALVLREEIGSGTLSYIQLAEYALTDAQKSKAPLIALQDVIDNLMSFWGAVDDDIDDRNVRNIIKAGKRLERLDLYARLKRPREELFAAYRRLNIRIRETNLNFDEEGLDRILRMLNDEALHYRNIVAQTEEIVRQ